jgi:DNA-directed RNA polymerase subunit RPC12/RpoP
MGCLYIIECPQCHKPFEWNEGPGAVADVLHCDKCGQELWTTERLLEFENIKCQCGGSFDKDVPIICPFCGREVEKPREFIKEAIMWD